VPTGPTQGHDEGSGLARWFEGPLGEVLLAKESEVLFQGVRRLHGDALLWLGPIEMTHLELDRCMVRQRVFGAMHDVRPGRPVLGGGASVYRGRIEQLPFAPASLDAVVVHHAFDCTADPRGAIREIAKALRPGGRVLICGFNPWSFWGLRRVYASFREPQIFVRRFVSPARLLDWLAVLGFDVDDDVRYSMYRPPVTRIDFERSGWARLRRAMVQLRLPVGGVYFVLARKSAIAVSRIMHAQSVHDPKLRAVALPGSTARLPE